MKFRNICKSGMCCYNITCWHFHVRLLFRYPRGSISQLLRCVKTSQQHGNQICLHYTSQHVCRQFTSPRMPQAFPTRRRVTIESSNISTNIVVPFCCDLCTLSLMEMIENHRTFFVMRFIYAMKHYCINQCR